MNTLQDFSNDDFLSSLIETSINDRFHCDQCERTYSSAKLLRQHQAQHHNNASQTYVDVTVFDPHSKTCYVCAKRFSKVGYTFLHYAKVHNMKGPLSCTSCDKRFFSSRALVKHQHQCHVAYGKECPSCKKVFSSPAFMREHFQQYHNNATQTYVDSFKFDPRSKTCYVCNRRFSRLGAVQKHYTIVHNMKGPLSCSHEGCDLHFFTEKALSRHKNKCVTQR